MKTDEQVAKLCAQVAHESWKALNRWHQDYARENNNDFEGCEIYLYVRSDGNWVIDHAQYLTDHRNIVATVSLQLVNGPTELAEQIEQEWNDDFEGEEE